MTHQRHLCIVINHRFYGVDLGFSLFRGAYTDELNKSHAEIAAQYERGER